MMITGSGLPLAARRNSLANASRVVNVTGVRLTMYWPEADTPTLTWFGRSAGRLASAVGRLICSSEYFEYVVVMARKMTMTISTSMKGTRLISGSSWNEPRRKFIACLPVSSALALALDDLDQLDGLDFHFHHERIHPCTEVTVEHQTGYGDDDAERGVVQRNRDAVRELGWIGHPGRTLGAKYLD